MREDPHTHVLRLERDWGCSSEALSLPFSSYLTQILIARWRIRIQWILHPLVQLLSLGTRCLFFYSCMWWVKKDKNDLFLMILMKQFPWNLSFPMIKLWMDDQVGCQYIYIYLSSSRYEWGHGRSRTNPPKNLSIKNWVEFVIFIRFFHFKRNKKGWRLHWRVISGS